MDLQNTWKPVFERLRFLVKHLDCRVGGSSSPTKHQRCSRDSKTHPSITFKKHLLKEIILT